MKEFLEKFFENLIDGLSRCFWIKYLERELLSDKTAESCNTEKLTKWGAGGIFWAVIKNCITP